MGLLHPVTDFGVGERSLAPISDYGPDYWYAGRCPDTQQWRRLPRTREVEAIARGLMQQLDADPQFQQAGKMYGVLLVQTPGGESAVLKAFSGGGHGQPEVAGWVPPIPGRAQVALLERQTLRQLEQMKQAIIALQQIPERATFAAQSQAFADRLSALAARHRQNKGGARSPAADRHRHPQRRSPRECPGRPDSPEPARRRRTATAQTPAR